jgi:hypothetical protein
MESADLAVARRILATVRDLIAEATGGDERLGFALRRYVYKNLSYDERGTPAQRTKLKLQKIIEQGGKCGYPGCLTPDRPLTKEDEPELDRIDPVRVIPLPTRFWCTTLAIGIVNRRKGSLKLPVSGDAVCPLVPIPAVRYPRPKASMENVTWRC